MEHGKSSSVRLTDYPGICHCRGLFVMALTNKSSEAMLLSTCLPKTSDKVSESECNRLVISLFSNVPHPQKQQKEPAKWGERGSKLQE